MSVDSLDRGEVDGVNAGEREAMGGVIGVAEDRHLAHGAADGGTGAGPDRSAAGGGDA